MDDNGHGTHVSGTIGAVGNNALGVAGVNWLTQIMGLKFLGSNGSGLTSAAVSALNYATMMRNSYDVDIRLTNNSWGGGAFSQAMSDAIAASGNAGMLFVAAAGNGASDIDATPYYPASYGLPNMIVVAATDSKDALASYSNYGASTVDLAAPGSSVLSTYPNNSYASMSGTSMAAPHVSGAAALAWGYAPAATYSQIQDVLFDGVDPLPALTGIVGTGGRLNIHNALDLLPSDAGDTLATARATRLLALAAGDHFVLASAKIGDGTYGAKDVDLYRLTAAAGNSITAITSPAGGWHGDGHGVAVVQQRRYPTCRERQFRRWVILATRLHVHGGRDLLPGRFRRTQHDLQPEHRRQRHRRQRRRLSSGRQPATTATRSQLPSPLAWSSAAGSRSPARRWATGPTATATWTSFRSPPRPAAHSKRSPVCPRAERLWTRSCGCSTARATSWPSTTTSPACTRV